MPFGQTYWSLRHEVDVGVRAEANERHITRHTILGRLHETKKSEWNAMRQNCEFNGEALPVTPADLFTWADKLDQSTVRTALGMTVEAARKLKSKLRFHEIRRYYDLRLVEVAEERHKQDELRALQARLNAEEPGPEDRSKYARPSRTAAPPTKDGDTPF